MGFALLGICGLISVCGDFLLTTVGITGRRLPSRRVARAAWQILKRVLRHVPGGRILIGPLVMSSIAGFWIAGTALSWLLIFQASDTSVLVTDTRQPAGWVMDLGFIGEALSTLGAGNSSPGSTGWELATVLVAVNGMIVMTLSVSFVLNTTQTVKTGRAFLAHAAACQDFESSRAWDLHALADLVAGLTSVPHALYYSTPDPDYRLPEGLARFSANWLDREGNLRGLRTILRGLPNFEPPEDAGDRAFLARLEEWSRQFSF
ncbi:hypothetical protein J4729_23560 [Leisingera sp. HS039]|uniref:hypothetical protein n=1 Tax=unclassified Leisingera TaxID=2614906 RepID=UPI00107111CB|nr:MULTISPECIES: hypothetical protein [unclassified Leisingera]MBQ4827491.1 hypothetical protein [Leisingera sp. HS039]QBR35322.1 hypothetical protein ETW23_03325 [Leisingera sp. NJS201]